MAEVDKFHRDFLVGALHNKYVPLDAEIENHPHARAIRELQTMACDYGLPTVDQLEERSWAPKPDMELFVEQLTRLKHGVGAFGVSNTTVFGGHTLVLPDTRETLDWRGMLRSDKRSLYFPAYLGGRPDYNTESMTKTLIITADQFLRNLPVGALHWQDTLRRRFLSNILNREGLNSDLIQITMVCLMISAELA
jgi:hypothetical protein